MTKDFLFEIGTEEIPAGAMPSILIQVEELAKNYLAEERLAYDKIRVLGTPRRIALLVDKMAEKADDLKERHKGPAANIAFTEDGEPTKAAMGFARGKGLTMEDIVVEDGYIYAETLTAGKTAKEIAQDMLPVIVKGLSFPKSMRWGNYDDKFIRPVRWFVALLDEEVLPFEMASAVSTKVTRGHRFLGEREVMIKHPSLYVQTLHDNCVIVDHVKRRAMIHEQLELVAKEHKGQIIWDEGLLDEVTFLVEYPTALCGSFAESFLSLPDACLITPMKDHQRYFPMVDENGKLMAKFLTVRNGNKDHIDTVRSGNERVLRARLEDARFFFDEDRKTPMIDRLDALHKIVFQEGLGDMYDKTERLQALGEYIGELAGLSEDAMLTTDRAALLSKTDLSTAMVVEFTELQGVMGKEYALLDGEDPEVCEAIFEQYLPRFAGDILPKTDGGAVLSIADKVDNIVATFSRGLIPTGSQDPYALRRQTIGVLNILIASGWDIHLEDMFRKSAELLNVPADKIDALLEQLNTFFMLRLKNIYLDRQWPHEVIDLLLSRKDMTVASNEGMAEALLAHKIYDNTEFMQSFTRIYNLVKEISFENVAEELLKEEAEKALYKAAKDAHKASQEALAKGDYKAALAIPETLTSDIDTFFEAVMVMDKEEAVKNNRLQLLRLLYETFAPFGEIVALK